MDYDSKKAPLEAEYIKGYAALKAKGELAQRAEGLYTNLASLNSAYEQNKRRIEEQRKQAYNDYRSQKQSIIAQREGEAPRPKVPEDKSAPPPPMGGGLPPLNTYIPFVTPPPLTPPRKGARPPQTHEGPPPIERGHLPPRDLEEKGRGRGRLPHTDSQRGRSVSPTTLQAIHEQLQQEKTTLEQTVAGIKKKIATKEQEIQANQGIITRRSQELNELTTKLAVQGQGALIGQDREGAILKQTNCIKTKKFMEEQIAKAQTEIQALEQQLATAQTKLQQKAVNLQQHEEAYSKALREQSVLGGGVYLTSQRSSTVLASTPPSSTQALPTSTPQARRNAPLPAPQPSRAEPPPTPYQMSEDPILNAFVAELYRQEEAARNVSTPSDLPQPVRPTPQPRRTGPPPTPNPIDDPVWRNFLQGDLSAAPTEQAARNVSAPSDSPQPAPEPPLSVHLSDQTSSPTSTPPLTPPHGRADLPPPNIAPSSSTPNALPSVATMITRLAPNGSPGAPPPTRISSPTTPVVGQTGRGGKQKSQAKGKQ